jgi:mono/diheme cytochrome c family protein
MTNRSRSHGSPLAGLAALAGLALVATACSIGGPPGVPDGDPVLMRGRAIYASMCASCHGADGGGGRGPALNGGRLLANFPDPEGQAQIIREGRNAMPRFDGRLSEEEIDAVVRYSREVIALVD